MSLRLSLGVSVVVTAVAGCQLVEGPDQTPCQPSYARTTCDAAPDGAACRWARLYDQRVSGQAIAEVTSADDADLDAALTRLVPALAGKTLADRPPPASVPARFEFENFAPYEVSFPVDWTANPYDNNSWQLYFQDLSWLYGLCQGDDAELDTATQAIVDWVDQALYADPALAWTWDDHALAIRLDRAAFCLDQYVARRQVIDRRVAKAAASIILTHLYALGSEACYVPENNHGVMQDLAVLSHARSYPNLAGGEALWNLARDRLDRQVAYAVTADGIHVENSPDYQVLFLRVLTDAISVFQELGETPSELVTSSRDRLMASLTYQLQPNLTLPQFGDTENGVLAARLTALVSDARAQATGDPAVYDQLDWVVSRGARGAPPVEVDRVFPAGGYAAFRSSWDAGDPASAVTGHFACKRQSTTHYHQDDTSFELYGYGQELVVDAGKYSYDRDDLLVHHQYGVFAHNVVTIDREPFDRHGTAQILASGGSGDLVWVQGAHTNYQRIGIAVAVRTFAFAKPDTFLVIDHFEADGAHTYVQHFHLHPTLSDVTVDDRGTVIARSPDRDRPSLVLAPSQPPSHFRTMRGVLSERSTQGWYFAGFRVAEPADDTILRYERSEPVVDLPVVITISPPGQQPSVPSDVTYHEEGDQMTVSWTLGGARRSATLPRPGGAPVPANRFPELMAAYGDPTPGDECASPYLHGLRPW